MKNHILIQYSSNPVLIDVDVPKDLESQIKDFLLERFGLESDVINLSGLGKYLLNPVYPLIQQSLDFQISRQEALVISQSIDKMNKSEARKES